ncbi:hypothetical protein Esti_002147 [Eimeria stiedai]
MFKDQKPRLSHLCKSIAIIPSDVLLGGLSQVFCCSRMAAAWRVEAGVQFPSSFKHAAPTVKAIGYPNTEDTFQSSSVGSNCLLFKHPHGHRALAGTSALTLVLAALALTYMLVTCVRHLSKSFTFSSQQSRLLASNFPHEDKEACPASSGDGEQEIGSDDTEGLEGAAAPAVSVAGDLGAPGPAPAAPAGQTCRRLPREIRIVVGRTLLLLQQPVAVLTPLVPILRPDHCLTIVRSVCSVAALEMSAFSTVPPCLQPLRQQAAHAYIGLIERVLVEEPTAGLAVSKGWDRHLRLVQMLLQKLAQIPPETEQISRARYLVMMTEQQQICHWTLSQMLHVLQTIKEIKTQCPTSFSDEAVFDLKGILTSLFMARRRQVLQSVSLRYWLETHHRQVRGTVMYSQDVFDKARHIPSAPLSERLRRITAAVINAGGQPVTQFAPLPPLPEDQQHQQKQASLNQLEHGQHPLPPHTHPPQADGPAPVHSATPPAHHPHPLVQPSPQAPYMPQPPQPPHPPRVAAQLLVPFDPTEQDAQFPAINPDPEISGQHQAPELTLQIALPPTYEHSYVSVSLLDEPSTSFTVDATFGGGFGDPCAHTQPSGSSGQPQPPQASSQHTPSSAKQDFSSDEEDP